MAIRIVNKVGVSDLLSELLAFTPVFDGTCVYCIENNNTYLWSGIWNLFDNSLFYEKNPVPSISAIKVTEDSTHRFTTDSEKSTWNNKQDTLVSGSNIKTINTVSILGSGDITVSGSGLAQYQVRQLTRR